MYRPGVSTSNAATETPACPLIEYRASAELAGATIVAQGPLLVGAGIGYKKNLGTKVAFVADLDAIAGIAVTKSFAGSNKMTSGLSGDLSLGFLVGF